MKRAIIVLLFLLSACVDPKIEFRQHSRFVYGWTGIDTQTRDPFDPYVDGLYIVKCPNEFEKNITTCNFYTNGIMNTGFAIVIDKAMVRDDDLAARTRFMMDNAPTPCTGEVKSDTLRMADRAYPYGFGTCKNLTGNHYALLLINRWGRTYMFQMHRNDHIKIEESEILHIVQKTKFPA